MDSKKNDDFNFTIDDILNLPEGIHMEMIDGMVYDMATPSPFHQEIVAFLVHKIAAHIEKKKGKCVVYPAPFGVFLKDDKKNYLDLLLLADEQESMIDRYLERGMMYALSDDGIRAVCVVTDEGDSVLEIKNIAVSPAFQHREYGRKLIAFLESRYRTDYRILQAGTSAGNVAFYEKCGFQQSGRIRNFFTENYDHPIFENGQQIADMIYLKKILKEG